MIGGRSVYARNIVGGMTHIGVELDYHGGDTVMNNYIGTNKTGTAALKNRVGLMLYVNANNHVIGTNGDGVDDHLEGNLISGNQVGMEIYGSHNNKISGNLIGTDFSGLNALPNENNGFVNNNSNNNIIGGSLAAERNIISGNLHNGIAIYGSSSNNKVYNNFIGTNINGTGALGNGHSGILLEGANNFIGNGDPANRNIISGNLRDGIYITGGGTTGNKIQGNIIGTDITGMQDLGNVWSGIHFVNSANNNIIGSDEDGSDDINEGNLICCNCREGSAINPTNANILLNSSSGNSNIIRGNMIGTDITGKAVIGPDGGARGIQLRGGTGTIIGGHTPTARNIISGHKHLGIEVLNLTQAAIIQGNYIGTDIDGLSALGNTNGGISLSNSHETLIGTDEDGVNDHLEGNVISANGIGVSINSGSNRNRVAGNLIGTDVTGNTALGNTFSGVEIRTGDENHIGGTTTAGRNIISGNTTQGILFGATTNNNQVYNNFIGLSKDSTSALPNGSDGIRFTDDAVGNVIGGATENLGNVIAYNQGDGINVVSGTQNAFRKNIYYENDGLAIDLNNDGVTTNDLSDADTGPNNLQNFPFILTVDINASSVDISGIMYSEASQSYELDFYANSIPDPSGHGEGMVYLGTTTVTTDASGIASYSVTFNKTIPANYFISATATDPLNNTSEFSGGYGDPLPVTLLKFEVFTQNNLIKLQWMVAQERNLSRYVIYTSVNGIDFDSIGYVIANGSSVYQFSISDNFTPVSYYKLKIVDEDGSYIYSPVRSLQHNRQLIGASLFPNPVKDIVYVRLPEYEQEELMIEIINSSGIIVHQDKYHPSNRIVPIPVNDLQEGIYKLLVKTSEQTRVLSLHIQ
ncbi:MAG TPA: T9SS type A sorting domain-containing protein [Cytophagaceae bacterium]